MTVDDPAAAPTHAPGSADGRAAQRLLADLRAEIALADGKAAVLVAVLGMTTGIFTGLLANSRWSPSELSAPSAIAWWSGTLALALALFALLMAVLPRYGHGGWAPGQPLAYFGDIQRAARHGHLATALTDTAQAPVAGLMTALIEMSRIATRKHQWIRTGLIAFGCGAVLLPGSLLAA
ncbi:Pycsar system effector family protein [Streptomyces sparsogenes]|uniref:Pycsar system effector family protein n=1 Tax=Streptomyces sparsogenes TaxID=67365 RepID=UPI0033C52891